MKKTILLTASVAALFAGAPALAQVQSEVDQTGDSNDAIVSQDATGDTNSWVTQTGTNNEADVEQSGDNNNSTVYQRQTETYGTAGDDPSNRAVVDQTGSNANLTINQTGNNLAEAEQGGANNAAYILQIGGQPDTNDDNQARLYQTGGSDQAAAIVQIGANNDAEITQQGQGFGAPIPTEGEFFAETADGAAIVQYANENVASIEQTSGSIDGGSLIAQFTDGNEAHSTQTGDSAFSEIYQFGGSGNFANVEQGGVDADSFVVQNGNNNEALVGQVSGSSFVSQAGDGNVAHVTQGGAALPGLAVAN